MARDRDELLSAYLDGELDKQEMAEVEVLLAADPALSAELERLAVQDTLLAQAMHNAIPDEVDDDTARRFGLAAPKPVAANDDRPWGRWFGTGGAVAAAAAALFLVMRPGPSEPWTGERFDGAMTGTASMQQASLGDDGTLTPLLSFQAADGRYCREFRLAASEPAQSRDGIACRDDGHWQAVALVATQPALADPSRIEVAGGEGRAELDQAYDKLGSAAPLSAADERSLIDSGWESPISRNGAE